MVDRGCGYRLRPYIYIYIYIYIYTLLHFHSGVGGLGGEDFSPMNMSLRTLWPGFSPVNQLAELE